MKECKFSLKVRKYITLLASLLLVFFTSELLFAGGTVQAYRRQKNQI